MTNTIETNHAESQAKAQLESIKEMIAAMSKDESADLYASNLSREKCIELLASIDIDSDDDESTEDLREAVAENIKDDSLEPDDFEFDEETARETIQEDALEIQVRSDWHSLGEESTPSEYYILLCTGGPAVRIIGELDRNEPSSARLQYQDWGTSWTEYITTGSDHDALMTYAQQFYFGE
jgi:hypothetical protein